MIANYIIFFVIYQENNYKSHKYIYRGPPCVALVGHKNICAAFGRTFIIIFQINNGKYSVSWSPLVGYLPVRKELTAHFRYIWSGFTSLTDNHLYVDVNTYLQIHFTYLSMNYWDIAGVILTLWRDLPLKWFMTAT